MITEPLFGDYPEEFPATWLRPDVDSARQRIRQVVGYDRVFRRIEASLEPLAGHPEARESDRWKSLVLASCDFPGALDRLTDLYPCGESRRGTSLEDMSREQLMTLGLVNAMTATWPGLDHVTMARDYLENQGGQIPTGVEWLVSCAIRILLLSGDPTAAACAAAARQRLGGQNPVGWRARLTSLHAVCALLDGDVQGGVEWGERALRMMQPRRWAHRIGEPLATVVLGNLALGRIGAAVHHLRTTPSALMDESSYSLWYRHGFGHFCLGTGDPRGAVTRFMSCGRSMAEWGMALEHLFPWRLAAAAGYQMLGEQDVAVHLVDAALQARGDEIRARAMQTADTVGEVFSGAREAILTTLERFSSSPDFFLILRRLQTEPLDFDRGDYATVTVLERRPVAFLSTLTDSELKVATLAGRGKQNKMIARDLSITISTVEQHLTHVYKKLGIGNRKELRLILG
ncbi:helix-turn-helix transcriptional regulator [Micromonospora sp. HM134]|nr:helix-turn-helix transcriptional regulator [Micromonospora sp. HM134]